MRFLALLRGGALPKFAAEAFLDVVFSEEQDEFFFEHAANFIMDCFDAIDLKLSITANDVENKFENFEWPVELLQIYVFKYNRLQFSRVEQFLYEIFNITQSKQRDWLNIHKEEITAEYMEEHSTPLDVLVQLIAAWYIASKHLLNSESLNYFWKYFQEPIARIDFQLLSGLNELRRCYLEEMPILNSICDRLLRRAQQGILYPEAHSEIVKGLLNMFNKDIHLFYEFSKSSTDFYYKIFTTGKSYQLVFKSFIDLLQKYCNIDSENTNTEAQQRSLMITNFMVDSKMLKLYYYTIVKGGNKTDTLAALDFLDILQSKLVSLDCFPEAFVEGILDLVFSADTNIGKKAAKTYITMMQSRSDAESTFKHIIGYYYAQKITPEVIPRYVQRLWKYFRPITNIDYYAELLQQSAIAAESRIAAAHFTVAIFNLILNKYGIENDSVVRFLHKLVNILKQLKCQITQGILLDVFDTIKFTNIETEMDDLKEIFMSVEEYAQHLFVSLENLQYPLLKKWFLVWQNLTPYSENLYEINESALTIVAKYNEFKLSREDFLKNLNQKEVRYCRLILQRLSLVIQSHHFILDDQSQILKDLRSGLMNFEPMSNGGIYDYAFKYKDFIDVYALEIYTISLIKIYNKWKTSLNQTEYEWLKPKALEFENHLRSWIQNTEIIIEQPMIRIKTIFVCFLELHLVLGSDPNNKILSIPVEIYEILVRLLTYIIVDSKKESKNFNDYDEDSQVYPTRVFLYQSLMIEAFSTFHKCFGTEINTHYIWHFCLYFGLPQGNKFKDEFFALMQTLVRHNFVVYKRIIPIIVHNLYTLQPALNKSTILKAIKAHKSFIDNLEISDRELLNLEIVLSVIDRMDMLLKSNAVNSHRDRLASLQHLYTFLENLNLNVDGDGHLINLIYHSTIDLRRNLLNSLELKTMENFLKHFHAENN